MNKTKTKPKPHSAKNSHNLGYEESNISHAF